MHKGCVKLHKIGAIRPESGPRRPPRGPVFGVYSAGRENGTQNRKFSGLHANWENDAFSQLDGLRPEIEKFRFWVLFPRPAE